MAFTNSDRNALDDDDKNRTVLLGINNTTSGINTTFPEYDPEQQTEKLPLNSSLLSVCILVAAFGIIGNIVTMVKIVYDSKLHTPTFAAIGHLAFVNFLALIVLTVHLILVVWVIKIKNLWTQLTVVFISDTLYLSSACHVLLLLSVRYLITVHPLQSRRRLTVKAVSLCSMTVWPVSVLFGAIKSYFFYVHKQTGSHFMMLINSITYIIFLLLVCFITFALHVWKIRAIQTSRSATKRIQTRMNLVVTAIITVFAMFQIFAIAKSLYIYKGYCSKSKYVGVYTFFHLSMILSGYLTFSLNPYIFFFLSFFRSCTMKKKLSAPESTEIPTLDMRSPIRLIKMVSHFSETNRKQYVCK